MACGAATASPEALVAVSRTVPNVYRDPEVATNMTLPFHWDALIVNGLYKKFPSQVSIWASLNMSKNTNFPISSNVSNSGNFPATFSYNTVRSVRFNEQAVTKCSSSSTLLKRDIAWRKSVVVRSQVTLITWLIIHFLFSRMSVAPRNRYKR